MPRSRFVQTAAAAATTCALLGAKTSKAAPGSDCDRVAAGNRIQGNGGVIQADDRFVPSPFCVQHAVTDVLDYNPGVVGTTLTWQDPPLSVAHESEAQCEQHITDILVYRKEGNSFRLMEGGDLRIRGQFHTSESGATRCFRPRVNLEQAVPSYGERGEDYRIATFTRFDEVEESALRERHRRRTAIYVDEPPSTLERVFQLGDLQAEIFIAEDTGEIAPVVRDAWEKRLVQPVGPAICRDLQIQSALLAFSGASLKQAGFNARDVDRTITSLGTMTERYCAAPSDNEVAAEAEFQRAMLDYVDGVRSSTEFYHLTYKVGGIKKFDVNSAIFDKVLTHDLGTLAQSCSMDVDAILLFATTGELAEGYADHFDLLFAGCGAGTTEPAGVAAHLGPLGLQGPSGRSFTPVGEHLSECLTRESGEGVCNNPLAAGPNPREGTRTNADGSRTTTTCDREEDGGECTKITVGETCNEDESACIGTVKVCTPERCEVTSQCRGSRCDSTPQVTRVFPIPPEAMCEPSRDSCETLFNDLGDTANAAETQAKWDNRLQGVLMATGTGIVLAATAPVAVVPVGMAVAYCSAVPTECGTAARTLVELGARNTLFPSGPFVQQPGYPGGVFMCGEDFLEAGSPPSSYPLALGPNSRPMLVDDRIDHCMCEALKEAGANGLVSTLCPTSEMEQLVNECLDDPGGPDDAPRPICSELLGRTPEVVDAERCHDKVCERGFNPVFTPADGQCPCLRAGSTGRGAIPCQASTVAMCMDGTNPAHCGCGKVEEGPTNPFCRLGADRLPALSQWLVPERGSAFLSVYQGNDLMRVRTAGELTELATPLRAARTFATPVGSTVTTQFALFESLAGRGQASVGVYASVPGRNLYNRHLGDCPLTGKPVGQLQDCTLGLGGLQLEPEEMFNFSYVVHTPNEYSTPIGIGAARFTNPRFSSPQQAGTLCPTGPSPRPVNVVTVATPEWFISQGAQQSFAFPVWRGAASDLRVPRTTSIAAADITAELFRRPRQTTRWLSRTTVRSSQLQRFLLPRN